MRDLLDELARVRRNKVQAGLRELAGALSVVKLTNLACMEVNTIRPFFQAALDRFFRLRAVRARPGSPAGGAGTPRPPHAPPHPSRLGAQKGARTLPFLYPSLSFPSLPRRPGARPRAARAARAACVRSARLSPCPTPCGFNQPRCAPGSTGCARWPQRVSAAGLCARSWTPTGRTRLTWGPRMRGRSRRGSCRMLAERARWPSAHRSARGWWCGDRAAHAAWHELRWPHAGRWQAEVLFVCSVCRRLCALGAFVLGNSLSIILLCAKLD